MTETSEQGRPLLSQKRAAFALEKVQAAKGQNKPEDYGRLVRNLPMMILQNGLGQSVAFLIASAEGDKKGAPARVVGDIGAWLDKQKIYENADPQKKGDLNWLMQAITTEDRNRYMRAQQESLALLDWMKKFADAFIPKDKPKGNPNGRTEQKKEEQKQ